jgi:hypothetical protein
MWIEKKVRGGHAPYEIARENMPMQNDMGMAPGSLWI